ncbi:MAG: DUF1080 domain-containing protein [Bacteroidales bacterium]
MKNSLFIVLLLILSSTGKAQDLPLKTHPDVTNWALVFSPDLKNADDPAGVWTSADGVFTASKDEALWTKTMYENFMLDIEFKTDVGTNSGVIIYGTDKVNWIPNSVEIQILDDYADKWKEVPANWQCGAIFGHLAPSRRTVKHPGEWNRMTIVCRGQMIDIVLNGEVVNHMDMSLWKSAKVNPDGSEIPSWLNRPYAELPTKGYIGFQGKHADAPVFFRNIRIKELKPGQ